MIEVVCAIVAGACSVLGVIITNIVGNRNIMARIETRLSVQEANATNLADRVKEHQSLVESVPTLKVEVDNLEKRVEKIENRVLTLETKV